MTDNYQYALVGNLMAGGISREQTLAEIRRQGFKPEYVTDPGLRSIYDKLVAAETNDGALLIAEIQPITDSKTIQKLAECVSVDPTDYERVVMHVKNKGIDVKILEMVNARLRQNASGEMKISELVGDFSALLRDVATTAASGGFSLADLGKRVSDEENDDCLFAGGLLEKGGALLLASVTGSGKSTLLMQLALAWALGREMFGLRPMRPLKIGIFQTENSDRDLVLFAHDVQEGAVRFCQWTKEDLEAADKNIRIFASGGKTDDEFLSLVRLEQLKGKFDLIVFDPLSGVTTFDISDNTKMNDYLLKKVDPIIKHDAETKCGLMIIHHTNKPPAANMRTGFGTDQYAQYVGAGAGKLPGWARAIFSVMPTDEPGQFKLVAAKRGERLDWPLFHEKPGKLSKKPTRLIRHSTRDERLIFWHEVGNPVAGTAKPEKPCVTKDAARLADVLQKDAMTLTEARNRAKEMFDSTYGGIVYKEMMANLSAYNICAKPTGKSNSSIVGSPESIEKWFSAQREKEASAMRIKLAKMDAQNQ